MTDIAYMESGNSRQIEQSLCKRLEALRLARNITQQQLADEAGVSLRTIGRMEKGLGVSLDTFLRVLIALRLQGNLDALLPDPQIRPMERIGRRGKERKRARPKVTENQAPWDWGEDEQS